MPGRAPAKLSRSSAHIPKSGPAGLETPGIPDEGSSGPLRSHVCSFFADAQRSITGHRKLVVGLRKVQEACCYEPISEKKNNNALQEDFDENDFASEVARCVLRILPVKKSEPVGDRTIRFLGSFLKHATDADNAIFAEEDPERTQAVLETPTSRLTSQIISMLLPLLQAKDKIVRFRCAQITSHLINRLDCVDDELFNYIRVCLLKRLRDRETNVRVQAVCGLGRLAGEGGGDEDAEDSDDDTSGGVLDRLLDVLQNDPSAEVRRSLLLNLPFTPTTLPFLLERARDLDSTLRRALYARLLPALGDFRHLSLTHREKLLRWGLRDRDENVRKATGRLFSERWIEDCARPRDEEGEPVDMKPGQMANPSSDGLFELLERIDVVNAGTEGGVALSAMQELWERRPDYRDFVAFDEAYWKDLTPESVFVARTFNDHCRKERVPDSIQDKLPEATRVAYLVQANINTLVDLVQKIALQDDAEEDSVHQEFIVEQLLHIALTLDYSDEVGRRTMFSLMREALALAELPEETTRLVVDVLRICCGFHAAGERDFCGVVLEAIAEVHDTIMGEELERPEHLDDSFHSAQSELSGDSTPRKQQDAEVDEEKAVKEIMVNMKCLHIAQCMLQNVECTLESNAHLVTMLNNLVVPAVRSQEAPIRERGLLCLGLCCLLDKNLADENLTLFLHCFTKGHEQLQEIAVQIIGDILTSHPSLLVSPAQPDAEGEAGTEQEHPLHKPVHKLFSKSLKSPSPSVQSTACAALCKLMLSAPSVAHNDGSVTILNVDELLLLLVKAYFDPDTASNLALRQSLSYFVPVFCHSRKENMQCIGRIAMPILQWCHGIKEELDVDGDDDLNGDMVGLSVVVAHLVDWTDGRKLVLARTRLGEGEAAREADGDVHLDMAEAILEKTLGVCSREERKLFISMLGKLFFTTKSEREKLQTVSDLVDEAVHDKIAADTTTRNILVKVQTSLSRCLSDHDRSQSGGASGAVSIAPSVMGHEDWAEVAEDAEARNVQETEQPSEVELPSQATTPATSPRKRANRRDTAPLSVFGVNTMESKVETPITSPTKRSARPRRTAASSKRQTIGGAQEGGDVDQENMPPPIPIQPTTPAASPQKNARGRAKLRTTANAGEPSIESAETETHKSEPHIKVEETEERTLPIRGKGRPPKDSTEDIDSTAPTTRRSGRTVRREVSTAGN